ncbi:MAG: NADH-quinone oxidoreductase subunit NuoN [Rubellimicrobium sp.]|nr:NADH-quinone oxidoreductase subunit NuoN [Rubellimicrobium sp.]
MFSADFQVILPEAVLAIYAMAALIAAVWTVKDRATTLLNWLTAILMALLALWIGSGEGVRTAFAGSFVDDGFARFAKVVILLAAASVLLMGQDYMRRRNLMRFEYPVLIALAVVGMLVMVSSGDLIALYMGVELQSLALYVVAAMRRDSARSTEAGLKYFVLGALGSGLMLYGASLTYGFAGTTLFAGIAEASAEGASLGLLFGLAFMLAGFAFKVSAAPFHMWTPDVYEGSPTPVTTFFATAPKMAGMGLFARVMFDAFGGVAGDWQQILAFLSVASMFLGAFGGIGQTNIKRMMAYSTISHMGFALMGLAAGGTFGVQAMLVYMAIYVTMDLGTFAFVMSMERGGRPVTDISSMSLLARERPLIALALLVLLFSLAGVPPTVGFFGKYYVLKAAYDGGFGWLAVMGVIASVIGAYYYLRIVFYMYFGKEAEPLDRAISPVAWLFVVGAAAVMVLGVVNLFGIEPAAAGAAAALVN